MMREFYKVWSGNEAVSKAEAFRRVQVMMIHGAGSGGGVTRGLVLPGEGAAVKGSFQHPFYWAPFVVIGRWF